MIRAASGQMDVTLLKAAYGDRLREASLFLAHLDLTVHLRDVGARQCAEHQAQQAASGRTQIFIPVSPLRLVFDIAALRPCVVESSSELKNLAVQISGSCVGWPAC